jgi:hypothetical protein
MSAQVKKTGRIGTKIVAVFLFLFLLMVNVEVGLYGELLESNFLNIPLGIQVQDAMAYYSCTASVSCDSHPADYVSCTGSDCYRTFTCVVCDDKETCCF